MNKRILEINELSYSVGNKEILKNISLTISEGDIFSLIGYNGAGKSSLIKLILGVDKFGKGTIKLFGLENDSNARKKMGSVFFPLKTPPFKTGREYLYEQVLLSGEKNKKIIREKIEETTVKTGSNGYLDKFISTYSDGMKKRLMLATALVGDPEFLILDEPFNGIDPEGMVQFRNIIFDLNKMGITFLITSHIINELLKFSKNFGVISKGEIREVFSKQELDNTTIKKTIVDLSGFDISNDKLLTLFPKSCVLIPFQDKLTVLGEFENDTNLPILNVCGASAEDIVLYKLGKGVS
ncbi:MAG: ABC transporter ATP-binding protein [Firmicutes bacterium]|nr:ABC transporter ATP-binding protein [Bacillota bacterium]